MNTGARLVRVTAGWLVAIVLAVLAAVMTINIVNDRYFSPQQPVRDYVQALRDGNGPKALGLLRASLPAASPALLNGDGLAAATAKLTDVRVGKPQQLSGGKVKIGLDYKLSGQDGHTDFTLEPAGREWMFFDTWRFVPTSLPTVDVSVVNQTQAQINGVAVAMPGGRNSFALLFPGTYTSTFQSPYFEAAAIDVSVTGSGSRPAAVALATAPTKELTSQVDAQIHSYLDSCAKQTVLMPSGCPMGSSSDNRVVGPVKWSIVDYPQVSISAFAGHWVLAPLTVDARVRFEEKLLSSGYTHTVSEEDTFPFTATLGISDDGVSVTPHVKY